MILNGLNEKQHEAVTYCDGPLLVLAGAGSGKTKVLTSKIAYLIEEKNTYSSQILAITFTNKAAKEMRERVEKIVGNKSLGMWIGTFHSIAVKMLRRDAPAINYSKDFIIYDPYDQKTLVKECLKELNIDEQRYPIKSFIFKISKAKEKMKSPMEYLEIFPEDRIGQKVYDKYEEKLKKFNAMDFDTILLKVIELLKNNPHIREQYRNHFKYVLVDEYQDTNKAQFEFVSLLTKDKGNVFVVGDIDQSIYGWRGADIRNIIDFEKIFPSSKLIKLEENYRSTQNILDLANTVIKNNMNRKEKNLHTQNGKGESIKLFEAYSDLDEADFVITKIQDLIEGGNSTSDIAILYRTNAQSRSFEDRLRRNNINYKIYGGMKFYDRKEIKDIISYLNFLINPLDEISLQRIINEPKRGIGDVTLTRIKDGATATGDSVFSYMISAYEKKEFSAKVTLGLGNFIHLIKNITQIRDDMKSSEIIKDLIVQSGYKQMLVDEGTLESKSRLENLEELVNSATEYELSTGDYSLNGYLSNISLQSDQDSEEEENSVSLMTLHSAKGLEFNNVFLVGLEEGLFPSSRGLENQDELEEERRLCYVGITRAKKELFISFAQKRMVYGKETYSRPSRFIGEMLKTTDIMEPLNKPKRKEHLWDTKKDINAPQLEYKQFSTKPSKDKIFAGSKVKHKMFGIGTVVSLKGDDQKMAHIAFDSSVGIKILHLDYAPLEVINE
jgi:DNA helicase-2/ATP-dependent DNA helicase PcrA